MNSQGWDGFWKAPGRSFVSIMTINTHFFASRIVRLFQLNSSVNILDYGCGPGLLADYFKTKGIAITGADINETFLQQCQENHPTGPLVKITTDLKENRLILEKDLQGRTFDFIILLSIIQYFKDED